MVGWAVVLDFPRNGLVPFPWVFGSQNSRNSDFLQNFDLGSWEEGLDKPLDAREKFRGHFLEGLDVNGVANFVHFVGSKP